MADILHVPFTYFPDRTGGTETYVAALARGLAARGVSSAVAAPVGEGSAGSYAHGGIPVHRFAVSEALPLEALHATGDPVAAANFARLLEREQPRVVHLHGWTSALSIRLVRAAHGAGLPVVLTYHTPSVSCARGTLMRYGDRVCDGALFVDRCARCVLQAEGLPLPLAAMLGEIPPAVGRALGRLGLQGGPWTALRMPELMAARHAAFRDLVHEADHFVAVQDWVFDLLRFLGVPESKLTLSRLALPEVTVAAPLARATAGVSRGPIRLAFFGRLDRTKGVHVVTDAMTHLPGAAIELDVYGAAPEGRVGARYLHELQRAAAADPRIRILPPVPTPQVIGRMGRYDALVVPSIWMETGPLVVPEAMAAGIPVLGSAIGGIPSFIEDGVDGLLVPPGDVPAWAAALRRLISDPALLPRLTAGVRPPESMARIIDEMMGVYAPWLRASERAARLAPAPASA